jgi:hypothetical protein
MAKTSMPSNEPPPDWINAPLTIGPRRIRCRSPGWWCSSGARRFPSAPEPASLNFCAHVRGRVPFPARMNDDGGRQAPPSSFLPCLRADDQSPARVL